MVVRSNGCRADRGVRPSGATPLREEVDLFLEKELGFAPSYTTPVDGNAHFSRPRLQQDDFLGKENVPGSNPGVGSKVQLERSFHLLVAMLGTDMP